jgi:F-type H+-transporting ATPase subunit delta
VKAGSRTAARRYAHALLEVVSRAAGASGSDAAAALAAELHDSAALLQRDPALRLAVSDPLASTAIKKKIVEAVWSRAGASPLLLRFLSVLVDRDRMSQLPEIEAAFHEAWNEARGVVLAEVVTAGPLESVQRQSLADALARISGLGVELRERVEPAVRGGVLVQMAGKSYDGTIRGRLQALKSRLVYGS